MSQKFNHPLIHFLRLLMINAMSCIPEDLIWNPPLLQDLPAARKVGDPVLIPNQEQCLVCENGGFPVREPFLRMFGHGHLVEVAEQLPVVAHDQLILRKYRSVGAGQLQ
ncbi:hypothetical protein D3C75_785140 [compost metagenome]